MLRTLSGDLAQGLAHVMWIVAGLGVAAMIAAMMFPAVEAKDAPASKR